VRYVSSAAAKTSPLRRAFGSFVKWSSRSYRSRSRLGRLEVDSAARQEETGALRTVVVDAMGSVLLAASVSCVRGVVRWSRPRTADVVEEEFVAGVVAVVLPLGRNIRKGRQTGMQAVETLRQPGTVVHSTL